MNDNDFPDDSDNRCEDSKNPVQQSCSPECTENTEDLSAAKSDQHEDVIQQNNDTDESAKPVSEEEGLNAAKGGILGGNDEINEDKEFVRDFLKYVKFTKKAKELGLDSIFSTTIYQGGNHFSECTVDSQNIVGHDQDIKLSDQHDQEKELTASSSVENTFDRHKDVRTRSFMIALAALNGCNYRIVVDTSQRLQSIIQKRIKEESEYDVDLGVNGKKRSEWLEDICACLSDGYELTEYGESPIKIVSFKMKEDSTNLFRYVWHEYDIYTEALLQWLYELGEYSNVEVRLMAAAVAGQLAKYEFRPVREKIFLPWAKADKQSVQRLTALALSIVAYDENEKTAQQALNILHHWSGLKNSISLHLTAIVAYGSYIGFLFPQQALDNLKIISQSGDGRLFPYIAQAVTDLFSAGQQVSDLHLTILNNLNEWIGQHPKTSLHQLSLIIFWGLMRKYYFIEDVNYPILLFLSKKEEKIENILVILTRNSLASDFTRELAIQELRSWLNFVEKEQTCYDALARIIFMLAVPGREQQRICSYLAMWSETSNTASRLLDLIKRHS